MKHYYTRANFAQGNSLSIDIGTKVHGYFFTKAYLFTYRYPDTGEIEYKLSLDRDITTDEGIECVRYFARLLKVSHSALLNLISYRFYALETPYFTVTNGEIVLSVEI